MSIQDAELLTTLRAAVDNLVRRNYEKAKTGRKIKPKYSATGKTQLIYVYGG